MQAGLTMPTLHYPTYVRANIWDFTSTCRCPHCISQKKKNGYALFRLAEARFYNTSWESVQVQNLRLEKNLQPSLFPIPSPAISAPNPQRILLLSRDRQKPSPPAPRQQLLILQNKGSMLWHTRIGAEVALRNCHGAPAQDSTCVFRH